MAETPSNATAMTALPEFQAAPELQTGDWLPLLSALPADPATLGSPASPATRSRLFKRVRRSASASRVMHTTRHADALAQEVAPGVQMQVLYSAAQGVALRPGEPTRAALIRLQPGAQWSQPAPDAGLQRDWLLLSGQAQWGEQTLHPQDYAVSPPGQACPALRSEQGAWLFLREAALPALPGEAAQVLAAHDAQWADFAPGIRRRVLWQRDGQAAMLYRTAPGAVVPHHSHRHDEECLMLAGDIFLDDVMLRALDYQLAPAGSGHVNTSTDTGVLLYAHGDLELDLQPA